MRPSVLGPVVRPGSARPLDALSIGDLRVACTLGVYPSERVRPQPIVLGLTLHLDTREAAERGDLSAGVDYAKLAGELRFLLETCRFHTLETAAHALARYLLLPPLDGLVEPSVVAVDLRLEKPEALAAEQTSGTPSLTIRRYADEQRYSLEQKRWGAVDIVHERSPGPGGDEASADAGFGIYRLRIAARSSIPTHVHQQMEEAELAIGSGLHLQGRAILPGSGFRWPRAHVHRWDNPTETEQAIVCVNRPGFLPEDEVERDVPTAALVPIAPERYYPIEGQRSFGSAS